MRAMRTLINWKLMFVLSIAIPGCQTGGPDWSTDRSPILGGSPTSPGQFPTVVALVVSGGQRGMCTGTLVGSEWVLTAAHCVHPQTLGMSSQAQVTAETQVVFDGVNLQANQFGAVVQAAETIPHPGFGNPGDPDVGLVRLSQPVTDREPSPMNLDPAAAPVGLAVTMVGYGVADNGSAGRGMFLEDKASVSCASNGVSDGMFLCFGQTDGKGKCSGDSGGPSFANLNGHPDTVVGITSFGDQQCQFFGADMRVDASIDFIREHAPALLCGADGFCEESCGTANVDPDCSDCTVDEDCDDGNYCDDGFCTPYPLTPGGLGSECVNGDECASGLCADGPDGRKCSDLCDMSGAECPEGFDCLPAGDTGACWPAEGEGTGGCNAGNGGGTPLVAFVLGLLGLLVVPRRRRRQ